MGPGWKQTGLIVFRPPNTIANPNYIHQQFLLSCLVLHLYWCLSPTWKINSNSDASLEKLAPTGTFWTQEGKYLLFLVSSSWFVGLASDFRYNACFCKPNTRLAFPPAGFEFVSQTAARAEFNPIKIYWESVIQKCFSVQRLCFRLVKTCLSYPFYKTFSVLWNQLLETIFVATLYRKSLSLSRETFLKKNNSLPAVPWTIRPPRVRCEGYAGPSRPLSAQL
jgi:hypothetical protein